MRKALFIICCAITISTQAQKRTSQFSIAAEAGVMATAQAYQAYNIGFGGSGKILIPTESINFYNLFHKKKREIKVIKKNKNYFTGTLEVMTFSGRSGNIKNVIPSFPSGISVDLNVATPSLTILPIKVGYKYFINQKFNAELEGGFTAAFVTKVQDSYPGDIGGYTFALGFGFLVAKKIDIGMRYELFQSTASNTNYTSFVGLRTMIMLDFAK